MFCQRIEIKLITNTFRYNRSRTLGITPSKLSLLLPHKLSIPRGIDIDSSNKDYYISKYKIIWYRFFLPSKLSFPFRHIWNSYSLLSLATVGTPTKPIRWEWWFKSWFSLFTLLKLSINAVSSQT